ncbi:MAG: relaxase/mobilization nuclease domain-containing protein [Bifidobacterium dentium]|uniref:relaxase/mobilization nuclease domain-containing protein n=1 Tax=Bifidobacterium dentium TaxID=1689 RepID=UPI001E0FF21F|nr:relaxase/mobilization nuclease domain-containing protein [Bifidobacterium dentium]MBS5693361.1 relaxase/mobilization nuclease domain-containing protein [Bifidobacterium dentium]
MAVVKLGRPVKSNLGGPNGAMAYIINPAKTDGGRLVSASYPARATDPDGLAGPMLDDNRRSPKGIRKDSRLAYHIKLSFSPDDPMTPERVHELGVEFAERVTGGEYKYVVATHTDRHHLHDHIMVCAASRVGDHLKARLPKDAIEQWRVVANEMCAREGLSVIFNPVTEQVARKMHGDGTTPDEDPTTRERDPKRVGEAPEGSASAPMRTSRRDEAKEPLERRYGMSMEELYASAKGMGVKDRLRMLIDLTSSGAENFEDWRDMLDVQGVAVTVRGRHLTFTMKDTGFKVRDVRLGQAYDMTNIMAGLARTPVIPITFNRRLVAKKTKKTVTVWLPGTHRRRKITFDANRLVDDGGSTLRAFLPRDRDQIILDRSNRYAGKTPTTGLYQWFGEPTSRLEPQATPERLPLRYGVSPAQQRYYQAQARRLDRLAGEAKALNAAIQWTRLAGGDSAKGLRMLRGKVRESHDELQSAVIALRDAIQRGDPDLVAETRGEMERREALLDRYEGELSAIEHEIDAVQNHERGQREEHQQPRQRHHGLSR